MCPSRILLPVSICALAWSAARISPPPTRADNVTETLHGVKIIDPYRWLEDQDSPETRAWIDSQSKFARGYLDPLPGRSALRARIAGLLKIDVTRPPLARNGLYFFMSRLTH
jgi:prolyl oligopeptidase